MGIATEVIRISLSEGTWILIFLVACILAYGLINFGKG